MARRPSELLGRMQSTWAASAMVGIIQAHTRCGLSRIICVLPPPMPSVRPSTSCWRLHSMYDSCRYPLESNMAGCDGGRALSRLWLVRLAAAVYRVAEHGYPRG